MINNPRHGFITTELDPAIKSSPFKIQTKWHVITGAACVGKTTLIEQLAEKGFTTVIETARMYFEQELAGGRSLSEILENTAALQRGIFELQKQYEREQDPLDIAFLDRALPDSLAFHRIHGLDPNGLLSDCFLHRYASVFILDRLPLHRSETLGPEDDISSEFLDHWLVRDYSALGYDVVRVPVLPPEQRLAFILDILGEQ